MLFCLKLQSHGPKTEDDSLQVPLLKDKKRGGSKAPAIVLGKHWRIVKSRLFAAAAMQYAWNNVSV